jgi:hypothetical protein
VADFCDNEDDAAQDDQDDATHVGGAQRELDDVIAVE